jgi:hypothetical protein
MDDELDEAIVTATDRTKRAAERVANDPIASPEILEDATAAENRAEDLHLLAADAADEATRSEAKPPDPK